MPLILQLNGTPLPGFDHRVSVQEQIESRDLSGEGSSSERAMRGYKPAILTVRIKVVMSAPDELAALRTAYYTQDGAGNPQIWDVTHPTTDALGIDQVRFFESFQVDQEEQQQLWQVTFHLQEVNTQPELNADRVQETAQVNVAQPGTLDTILNTLEGIAQSAWNTVLGNSSVPGPANTASSSPPDNSGA